MIDPFAEFRAALHRRIDQMAADAMADILAESRRRRHFAARSEAQRTRRLREKSGGR
jgi:hypothetical protein